VPNCLISANFYLNANLVWSLKLKFGMVTT